MRILVLTHNYPRFVGDPAGAFVARLAEAAAARGHEVRVVAPHAPGAAVTERRGGLHIHRFRYAPEFLERAAYRGDLHARSLLSPLMAVGVPAMLVAFMLAARRAAREFAPDVVHAHWWVPGGVLAQKAGRPFVVTCHGSDIRLIDRASTMRRLAAPVFQNAGGITCVSRFLANEIAQRFPSVASKIVVAPMPLDIERFAAGALTPRVQPPRILYAGNLVASKGVDVLIDAFAELRKRDVKCSLKILGEGPMHAALAAQARALGVDGDIAWSSFVSQSDMPGEYGASTVTVLPSRGAAEGLGLTLVEALLAGCAVVGTPAGGIPEVDRHEVTG
jgi:glycosyltransferase involved in cell wall biosynthesis